MSNPAKYQRHIDGLRAVAVLSVLFYHFRLPLFQGGFVGVDVFFVISGYLITRLILEEIDDSGRFSFKRFYIRRMRRLFPAMAVTFAASTVAAIWLFSPQSLTAFGRSLSTAVLSVSNILFWSESGYFDMDSHMKPLLHTWSLAVEEQFYMIWPALLWFCARDAGHGRRFKVLAALGLASFGLNILWVWGGFDPDYASSIFYLTPFRIFELVMGAMAIFIAPLLPDRRWMHELGMALGLVLIAYAVLAYTSELVFPYYYALVPCAGAVLVILCRQASTVGRILTNPVAVGVGLISYSMYLIHWPLVVFYESYTLTPVNMTESAGLIAVTTGLSILMYFFVEKTLRRRAPSAVNPMPQKAFVLSSSAIMAAIAAMGVYAQVSGGHTWRNAGSLSPATVEAWESGRFQVVRKACNLSRLDKPAHCKLDRPFQVLVIGNSHEPDGFNAFHEIYGSDAVVNLISFGTTNKCKLQMTEQGPVSTVTHRRCDERASQLRDAEFVSTLDAVIYSANQPFSYQRQADWDILNYLRGRKPELPIVVLGGYINTLPTCVELFNRFKNYDNCRNPKYLAYDPIGERGPRPWQADTRNLEYLYIDKTLMLCPSGELDSCEVQVGNAPAFFDSHHLTFPFAKVLGQRIALHYSDELTALGFPQPAAPAMDRIAN